MGAILTRAGCFVGIILLGLFLRRIGFYAKEDFYVLSKTTVRITLTASIIVSLNGQTLELSLFALTALGLGFGAIMMFAAWFLGRKRSREQQAFAVLNSSGVNIGNFVLPFARSFLGPVGVTAVCLFDVGNSFTSLGGAYSVAGLVKDSGGKFSVMPIVKTMARSVPLVTYLVMTVLSAARITLPAPAIEYAEIIAGANAFLAMLMIGVGFELSANREQLTAVLQILIPRYCIGIALAAASFFLLPLPLEYRQALVIVFLGPIPSAAPAFTADLKGDYGLASAVNSLSILISIALIVSALVLVL